MKRIYVSTTTLPFAKLRISIVILLLALCGMTLSAQTVYNFANNGSADFVVSSTDDATFDADLNQILYANQPTYDAQGNIIAPGAGVKVILNGTFTTAGLWGQNVGNGYSKLYFYGLNGNTNNTIKLKNAAVAYNDSNPNGPYYLTPFMPLPYVIDFKAQDLTIDCNWANQTRYVGKQNGYKSLGINVRCYTGYMSHVYVKNYGSDGGEFQNVESFAISLDCSLVSNSSAPSLTVTSCAVSDFTSSHGGYCTGIMLVTGAGRTSWTGTVSACNVWNVASGIAYGTANSSYVQFSGVNRCSNCFSAFNCDTAPADHININNNVFSSSYGINAGAPGWPVTAFTNFTISGNSISVTGPLQDCPYTYGIRLAGGNNYFTISRNTFGYNQIASYTLVLVSGQNFGGTIISDWYPTYLSRCN